MMTSLLKVVKDCGSPFDFQLDGDFGVVGDEAEASLVLSEKKDAVAINTEVKRVIRSLYCRRRGRSTLVSLGGSIHICGGDFGKSNDLLLSFIGGR